MKKGFTLVELLAVITILAVVSLIAINSLSGVREEQVDKVVEEKIKNIEKAAILYAQDNPGVFDSGTKCSASSNSGVKAFATNDFCIELSGNTLADNDYLDTDVDGNKRVLIDNNTGFNLLEYKIAVYKKNNRVYSSVIVSDVTKSTCPSTNSSYSYYYSRVLFSNGKYYCVKRNRNSSAPFYSTGTSSSRCDLTAGSTTESGAFRRKTCYTLVHASHYSSTTCPSGYTKTGGGSNYSYCCPSGYSGYSNYQCRSSSTTSVIIGCSGGYTLYEKTTSGSSVTYKCASSSNLSSPTCSSGKTLTSNRENCV